MTARLLFAFVSVLAARGLIAQNAVQAGRFIVEPPTLLNLGFEWEISGDANRNATVDVREISNSHVHVKTMNGPIISHWRLRRIQPIEDGV